MSVDGYKSPKQFAREQEVRTAEARAVEAKQKVEAEARAKTVIPRALRSLRARGIKPEFVIEQRRPMFGFVGPKTVKPVTEGWYLRTYEYQWAAPRSSFESRFGTIALGANGRLYSSRDGIQHERRAFRAGTIDSPLSDPDNVAALESIAARAAVGALPDSSVASTGEWHHIEAAERDGHIATMKSRGLTLWAEKPRSDGASAFWWGVGERTSG